MTTNQSPRKFRLRPHHFFCRQFPNTAFPEEVSETYDAFEREIKEILKHDVTTLIEVTEGIDDLCNFCPHLKNNRCENPDASEDILQKWDGILLQGLGLSYRDAITARDLRTLIAEKAPLAFCRTRCNLREGCGIFGID